MSKMAEEYKNSEVTWVAWQKGGHCGLSHRMASGTGLGLPI